MEVNRFSLFQSPPKGATIPYRPKPQVGGPVILAGGQAYTIQGNYAVPAHSDVSIANHHYTPVTYLGHMPAPTPHPALALAPTSALAPPGGGPLGPPLQPLIAATYDQMRTGGHTVQPTAILTPVSNAMTHNHLTDVSRLYMRHSPKKLSPKSPISLSLYVPLKHSPPPDVFKRTYTTVLIRTPYCYTHTYSTL